jgi:hypothetical protein
MNAITRVAPATPATSKRTKPPAEPTFFDLLPMAGRIDPKANDGRSTSFWVVKRTGDYGFDCYLGAELGRQTLRLMRGSLGGPTILNQIVRDMVRSAEFGGVEVGFLSMVAEAAIRGGSGRE